MADVVIPGIGVGLWVGLDKATHNFGGALLAAPAFGVLVTLVGAVAFLVIAGRQGVQTPLRTRTPG